MVFTHEPKTRIVFRYLKHFTIALLVISLFMFAVPTGHAAWSQIANHNEIIADIDGNKVIWERRDPITGIFDIYMYDLTSGDEVRITDEPTSKSSPKISGDIIVWESCPTPQSTDCDIVMKNTVTGERRAVTSDTSMQTEPAISGDNIVWADNRNNNFNWDIYRYEISTRHTYPVSTAVRDQYYPDIDGNNIIWTDNRYGNFDIFLYDISAGLHEKQLTHEDYYQLTAKIDGNKIVYRIAFPNNFNQDNLATYDLITSQETRLTNSISDQSFADISGENIVWMDCSPGAAVCNIDNYNFTTGKTMHLPYSQGSFPVISGDKVVWDCLGGICMYDLPPTAKIQYSTTSMTNQNVTATLIPSEQVTANGGSMTHTFTENGSFTFHFTDSAGNTGTAVASVNNIDKIAPTGTFKYHYDATDPNHHPVIAQLQPSESVTITNNGGSEYYKFMRNGSFTFELIDMAGNIGTATATVDNIEFILPELNIFLLRWPVPPIPYPEEFLVLDIELTYPNQIENDAIQYATNIQQVKLMEQYKKAMEAAGFQITESTLTGHLGKREDGETLALTISKSDKYDGYTQLVDLMYTKPIKNFLKAIPISIDLKEEDQVIFTESTKSEGMESNEIQFATGETGDKLLEAYLKNMELVGFKIIESSSSNLVGENEVGATINLKVTPTSEMSGYSNIVDVLYENPIKEQK